MPHYPCSVNISEAPDAIPSCRTCGPCSPSAFARASPTAWIGASGKFLVGVEAEVIAAAVARLIAQDVV